MRIDTQDKAYLKDILLSSFTLKEKNIDALIHQIYEAFSCQCYKFFYNLKYALHFKYNAQYANKILKVSMQIFLYFISHPKYRYDKPEIEKFFYNFLEIIFIENIRYSHKIEQRRDTVQQVLQHTSKKLNNILQTQELMIANISHDMRTSLNAIKGHLSLIEIDKVKDISIQSNIEKALSSTTILISLVNDILDISKINVGELEINKNYFYLDELLIKALNSINIDVNKKPIEIKRDIDFIPYQLYGDSAHLLAIIINLLSNAIKYTNVGFIFLRVKIEKESPNDIDIKFEIQDTGIGIDDEDIKIIFNPYTRVNDEVQGVGLGLHISSKILNALGGKLSVTSKVNQGSCFHFSLPFKKGKTKHKKIKKRLIYLYNDKNQDLNKIKFLEKRGAKLKYFDNKEKFINKLLSLKAKKPHIVSISSHSHNLIEIDKLISRLKKEKGYEKSCFIADGIHSKVPLKHFDKINEYITPISTYIQAKMTITEDKQETINEKAIYILSVDDIPSNLVLLKAFILKRYPNAIIDLAEGGYEALAMNKIRKYDIMFIDLKMPGLNGFALLAKLSKMRKLPPSYALSADVYKSTYKKVKKSKFKALLEKPFNIENIYNVIEKALDEKNHKKNK